MSDRSTESLLRELSRDLEPVRPIPRLHRVALGAVGALVGVLALHALVGGGLPGLVPGVAWGDGAYWVVLIGLTLVAAGPLGTALTGAVPGRESAARSGRVVALLGAGLLGSGGVWWLVASGAPEPAWPLASSLGCAGRAAGLALAPGAVLGLFLGRAMARRPLVRATWASVGAVALGAIVVHTTCPDGGTLHVPLGHCVAPWLAALVLAFPLSLVARRVARSV